MALDLVDDAAGQGAGPAAARRASISSTSSIRTKGGSPAARGGHSAGRRDPAVERRRSRQPCRAQHARRQDGDRLEGQGRRLPRRQGNRPRSHQSASARRWSRLHGVHDLPNRWRRDDGAAQSPAAGGVREREQDADRFDQHQRGQDQQHQADPRHGIGGAAIQLPASARRTPAASS